MVALQAQRRARMHEDALDLEPLAQRKAFEPAPGPVILGKLRRLPRPRSLQRRDRLPQVLRAVHRRDQHRVGHRHGDHVLQPEPHQHLPLGLGPKQRVAALQRLHRPAAGDTIRVARHLAPDGLPAPEVGPAAREGHDAQSLGPLHHGVVDRDILGLGPGRRVQPQEPQVGLRARKRPRHRLQHGGRMGREGGDQHIGPRKEQTRVPQVAPLVQHRLRRGRVRLFDEAPQRLRPVAGALQLKIAIARLGPVRANAEGHDPPRLRHLGPGGDGGAETVDIGHHVIRGRDQHQRTGVGGHDMQHRRKDRGRGVARRGLEQHRGGIDTRLGHLLGDDEAEIRRRHDDGPGKSRTRDAPDRGLEQRPLAHEVRELLGIALARQGPKPRAASAAQDDRRDRLGHGHLCRPVTRR